MLSQMAQVPMRKNVVAGRRKILELVYVLINGITSSPKGTEAMAKTPKVCWEGRRIWKTGYKYHSGRISSGVAKDLLVLQSSPGLLTEQILAAPVPRITTGKM